MFDAEKLLHFIELPQFTRRWEQLGLDDEEDLTALQFAIIENPKIGDVIRDTGGLRKMRFAPPRRNIGKSGATRVIYAYLDEFGIVLLCLVYGKNEMGDLSDAVKKLLRKKMNEIEAELRRRKSL